MYLKMTLSSPQISSSENANRNIYCSPALLHSVMQQSLIDFQLCFFPPSLLLCSPTVHWHSFHFPIFFGSSCLRYKFKVLTNASAGSQLQRKEKVAIKTNSAVRQASLTYCVQELSSMMSPLKEPRDEVIMPPLMDGRSWVYMYRHISLSYKCI